MAITLAHCCRALPSSLSLHPQYSDKSYKCAINHALGNRLSYCVRSPPSVGYFPKKHSSTVICLRNMQSGLYCSSTANPSCPYFCNTAVFNASICVVGNEGCNVVCCIACPLFCCRISLPICSIVPVVLIVL